MGLNRPSKKNARAKAMPNACPFFLIAHQLEPKRRPQRPQPLAEVPLLALVPDPVPGVGWLAGGLEGVGVG
jgi:hypothetical protein